MDPNTGYVKAYVGGINYKYFKYDHVKVENEQVGSTFKPFLYALAMQEGYSPCYEIPNVPVVFEKNQWGYLIKWVPRNSDDKYEGMLMSLRFGLLTHKYYYRIYHETVWPSFCFRFSKENGYYK